MTRRRTLLALSFTGALALAAAGLHGYQFFPRPGDGAPFIWKSHWTTLNMDPVLLPPSSEWGKEIRFAAKSWSVTPGTDFRFVVEDGFHDGSIGDLDGANDVYFAPLGGYVLGIAYLTDDSGSYAFDPGSTGSFLYDCDVAFTSYVVFWSPGYFDLQTTALHEFGHALGLAHSDVGGAVMKPFAVFGEVAVALQPDDVGGEGALNPPPRGGGRGFAPPTVSLPTLTAQMSNLAVSGTEVMTGDSLSFSARLSSSAESPVLLQAVETIPATSGTWEPLVLEPGEVREITVERTVADLPGDYEVRLRLGGYDPASIFVSQQTLGGTRVRVRRPAGRLSLQDQLTGSLGPRGVDAMEIHLVKGEKFVLDLGGPPQWGGGASAALEDPSGLPLPGWAAGKAAKARATGVHRLLVGNPTESAGSYRVFSTGLGVPPRIRVKGALDGEGPAEAAFFAAARTGGTLSVRAAKKTGARIVGLRSPAGVEMAVEPGATVVVEEFGEDGMWTAIVEGEPGAAGRFSLKGKTAWIPGVERAF